MKNQEDVGCDEETIEAYRGFANERRHEIRKAQRLLAKEIPNLRLEEAFQRNNLIYRDVRHVREAILDAENINLIKKKVFDNIDRLTYEPRYSVENLLDNLIQKCRVVEGGKSFFDWRYLGDSTVSCYNAVPSQVNFLNGPLVDGNYMIEAKKKAKHNGYIKMESDAEEERPIDIMATSKCGELSVIQNNIRDMKKVLQQKVVQNYSDKKRKIREQYGDEDTTPKRVLNRLKKNTDVCAIQLMFNPKSFTQTVENLYHYSCLVKDGEASLIVRDEKSLDKDSQDVFIEGGPVVKLVPKSSKGPSPAPRQAIVSLTMQDWKELIQAYDVESSDIPHRGP